MAAYLTNIPRPICVTNIRNTEAHSAKRAWIKIKKAPPSAKDGPKGGVPELRYPN
jgi:hypothetical protein